MKQAMTPAEYQLLAARTLNKMPTFDQDVIHMVAGVVGEFGEIVDLLKKSFNYGKPLDRNELIKELGDFTWYSSQLFWLFDAGYELYTYRLSMPAEIEAPVQEALLQSFQTLATIGDCSKRLVYSLKLKTEAFAFFDKLRLTLETYPGWICAIFGIEIHEVLEANIKKLEKRYPNLRFEADKAINRDHDAEDEAVRS